MRKARAAVASRNTAMVLGALLGILLALGAAAPAQADDEGTIGALVDQARWDAGLNGLNRNAQMDAVALGWARQLAANGTLSHNPDYASQIPAGWTGAAENVAQGYPTAQAVHDGWMNSAGHRANILGGYTDIGIALIDAGGSTWAVEVFGAYPGSVGPAAPAAAPAPVPPAAVPPAAVPPAGPIPAESDAASPPATSASAPTAIAESPPPAPASSAPARSTSGPATPSPPALARQAPQLDRAGADEQAPGGLIVAALLVAVLLAVLLAGVSALVLPGLRGRLQRRALRSHPVPNAPMMRLTRLDGRVPASAPSSRIGGRRAVRLPSEGE